MAAMQYNEIGQTTRKTLGTGRLTQDVDYAYNIRGWLTKLNDSVQPNPGDLFSLSNFTVVSRRIKACEA